MLKCFLDGLGFDVLWDTGSMVSMVCRGWLAKYFPDKSVINVSEFLGTELSVTAANKTVIDFVTERRNLAEPLLSLLDLVCINFALKFLLYRKQ